MFRERRKKRDKREEKETYAVVSYADDGTVGKVPRKNIVEDKDIVIGETYFVRWSDGKKYSAEVLFIGNEREATEKEHLLVYDDSDTGKEDNQEEDRCSEVPPKKQLSKKKQPHTKKVASKKCKKQVPMKQKLPSDGRKTKTKKAKQPKKTPGNKDKDNFTIEIGSPASTSEEEDRSDDESEVDFLGELRNLQLGLSKLTDQVAIALESTPESHKKLVYSSGNQAEERKQVPQLTGTRPPVASSSPGNTFNFDVRQQGSYSRAPSSYEGDYSRPNKYSTNTFNIDVRHQNNSERSAAKWYNDRNVYSPMEASFDAYGMDDRTREGESFDYGGTMDMSYADNIFNETNSFNDVLGSSGWSSHSQFDHTYAGNENLSSSPNFDFQLSDDSGSFQEMQADVYDENYVPPLPPPIVMPGINRAAFGQSSVCNDNEVRKKLPVRSFNVKKPKRNDRLYPITEVFNPIFLQNRKQESSSRANFAARLIKCFISKAVRMTSNVSGKRGKNKLDKDILAAVKVATFKMWPLRSTENEQLAWSKCVKSIDEMGRRLNRPPRSAKN